MTLWNQILQTSGCHIQSWNLKRVFESQSDHIQVVHWEVLGATRLLCSALPDSSVMIQVCSGSAEHFSVNNVITPRLADSFKFSTLNVTSRSWRSLIIQSHVNAVQTLMKECFFNQYIGLALRVAESPPRSSQPGISQTESKRKYIQTSTQDIWKFAKSDFSKSCTRSADFNERMSFQPAHSTRSSSREVSSRSSQRAISQTKIESQGECEICKNAKCQSEKDWFHVLGLYQMRKSWHLSRPPL